MKPYHGFKFKICWMNLGMNMAYDNEMDNPTTTFSEGVTKTCNLPPPQSVQADDSNFCFGNTGRRTPPPPCPTDPRSMINTFRFNPERQRDQRGRQADISRTQRPLRTHTTSPLFSCQSKSRSFFPRPRSSSEYSLLSRYHDQVRFVTIAFLARFTTRKEKRKNRKR